MGERVGVGTSEHGREVRMTVKRDRREATPEARLRSCVDRLDPKNQKLVWAVRAALRKRLPTANKLAYDSGRHLVIGYSPTDRGIESVVAIKAEPTGVSLYFSQGPQLPDPKRILRGSGKQTRFVQVEAASRLAHPDVEALIAAAIDRAKVPLPPRGRGSLIIKSAAANNRPHGKVVPDVKRRGAETVSKPRRQKRQ